MNEAEIREQLREAVGEAKYPGRLATGAVARLKRPEPEKHPRAIGLVGAIIALAVIAALLWPRLAGWHPTAQAGPGATIASPQPSPALLGWIPPGDFAAAGLSSASALVTPFQLDARSGNQVMTLIGAYADPVRTVLLLRTNSDFHLMMPVAISDELGVINASSSSGGGLVGEYFYSLDAGPHPGADGLAHLSVNVQGFTPSQPSAGADTFTLALKVQPSVAIREVPGQLNVGSWKVTVERAEVTPSVIDVQAVIDGASVADIGTSNVSLVDPLGQTVNPLDSSAGVTVPKQQLNSTNSRTTRVNDQWLRPTSAGMYQLHFAGGGGTQTIAFNVAAPDPAAALPVKGQGLAPKPTDFPLAPESLQLQGFLTTTLTSGRPNSCGVGTGPSGTIFAFGLYFQMDGIWYSLGFYTDPAVRQYSGPGTYTAQAWLYSPTQRLYAGTAQLTVSTDHRPDTGSVTGTFDRIGTTTQQAHLTVTGTWTCVPDPLLGPA